MQLIIISGLAGAGKSTALAILEDSGYNCVDNLPPPLLLSLVETCVNSPNNEKIAVCIDSRFHALLTQLPTVLDQLTTLGVAVKLIFLEARVDTLLKRFSETRRRHPLSDKIKTITECIVAEQQVLAELSSLAHRIDTSELSANDLRALIKQLVAANYGQLEIVVQSFGFKYGVPIDSDFVFDVRCLPNPYYDMQLRTFTGNDAPVIEFLTKHDKVQVMLDDIYTMLNKWLNDFSHDNRNYLTVSIGCTGGKHRSVYLVNALAKLLQQAGCNVITRHRQI